MQSEKLSVCSVSVGRWSDLTPDQFVSETSDQVAKSFPPSPWGLPLDLGDDDGVDGEFLE